VLQLLDGYTLALVEGGHLQFTDTVPGEGGTNVYARKLVPLASGIRGGVSPLIQGPSVVVSAISAYGTQVEPPSATFTIYALGGEEVRTGSATVNDEVISFSTDTDDYGVENRVLVQMLIGGDIYPETGYIHVAR
jgi:hypothetical protein